MRSRLKVNQLEQSSLKLVYHTILVLQLLV